MSITSQKAEIIHLGGKWNHSGTRGNHGQFVFVIISFRKGKNLLYTIQNPEIQNPNPEIYIQYKIQKLLPIILGNKEMGWPVSSSWLVTFKYLEFPGS